MIRAAAVLATVLTLGACAHLPVEGDGLSQSERQARLNAMPGWDMRGRVAVSSTAGGFQGSFQWRSMADAIELTVRGPFGAALLNVNGTPESLTVTARGDTWLLGDPEAELSELLGWWMPVASLRTWLIGLPDPAYRAQTEGGPLRTLGALEQRLWRVEYPAYQLSHGLLLPRRIDMRHGELSLRLTVDDFAPHATADSVRLN